MHSTKSPMMRTKIWDWGSQWEVPCLSSVKLSFKSLFSFSISRLIFYLFSNPLVSLPHLVLLSLYLAHLGGCSAICDHDYESWGPYCTSEIYVFKETFLFKRQGSNIKLFTTPAYYLSFSRQFWLLDYCIVIHLNIDYFRILLDRGFSPWDDGLQQVDLSGSGSYPGILGDYVAYIQEKKM